MDPERMLTWIAPLDALTLRRRHSRAVVCKAHVPLCVSSRRERNTARASFGPPCEIVVGPRM